MAYMDYVIRSTGEDTVVLMMKKKELFWHSKKLASSALIMHHFAVSQSFDEKVLLYVKEGFKG